MIVEVRKQEISLSNIGWRRGDFFFVFFRSGTTFRSF
uniref:Uncharacterized protein n=1 Tax=Ascaris lumbricoides TaxID=6252 RepID=A0A0M3IKF5_ASCLU